MIKEIGERRTANLFGSNFGSGPGVVGGRDGGSPTVVHGGVTGGQWMLRLGFGLWRVGCGRLRKMKVQQPSEIMGSGAWVGSRKTSFLKKEQ